MDRRIILLVVLFILMILAGIVNYHYFIRRKHPEKRDIPVLFSQKDSRGTLQRIPPAPEAKESPIVTPVKFEPMPVDASLLKERLASGSWGREPFLTAEELQQKAPLAEQPTPKEEATLPTVSSILIRKGGNEPSVAIINGESYIVGQKVKGYTVVDITSDGVLLERDGKHHKIQLRQGLVRVQSREK
ncbi:MAG TPA: hypothetical protein ACFYD3_09890 [Candidatus Hypogeohydataceae bacterium YC41]